MSVLWDSLEKFEVTYVKRCKVKKKKKVDLMKVVRTHIFCGQLCKNCEYGCDKETELCTGKCNPGWDGPTCSRRNVALGQRTTQSSVYTELGFSFVSRLAVDGRTGHMFFNKPYTCSHTETNPQPAFWTVTLDGEYSVYRFRIYNRNDVNCSLCYRRLNGFTLSVGSSSQNYKDCYHDTTTAQSGPGNIITKTCVNGPIFGNTVKIMITNSEALTLCEVQIFAFSTCEESHEVSLLQVN
ncbi:uncharacterized protein LOC135463448 [Liolophura sinensis]|uniref:uncharacterized protein LOC135463448 n=1 Tax=Liolophura sinensis TaxID=3198878 RepID=UPI003159619B